MYVNPETGSDTDGAGATAQAPYKTISFALSKAQAGTTIQLAPGTYSADTGEQFPLNIKSGVTLLGNDSTTGQAVLINGSGNYISRTFARQNVTILAENNSVISGVTVTNPASRGTGVWVESTNPIIKNSTFINSLREGVFVTGTGNPIIENNVFSGNQGNGVSIARDSKGVVRNNLFQSTGFGLAIGDNSTPRLEANRIIENTDGIFISNSAKPVLRKNVIKNNSRDGIVVISQGLPNLGTNEDPGENLISDNKRYDLNNATNNVVVAIGNSINTFQGNVDYVASDVEAPPGAPVTFKDVPTSHWANNYIKALSAKGVIAGFPDGTFKPNDRVTRAQFAAIINKAFTPAAKRTAINFSDVSTRYWGYQAIQTASRGGFLSGYPNKTFKPEVQIPRVQVLVSLANGLELTAPDQNSLSFYNDASQIPSWAKSPVSAATMKQIVVNYPTVKQLKPKNQATRAEVAAFVYQALVNAGRAEAIPSAYVVKVPGSEAAASMQN
ncbi:FOG: PKD repeat [Richelia intracellularis]|nr:FOG: PKD repeat [Richelia intracellularis]